MKQIKIIIERSKDLYTAYAENIAGIYSAGNTVEEAKESILRAIELYKKYNKKVPSVLKGKYALTV